MMDLKFAYFAWYFWTSGFTPCAATKEKSCCQLLVGCRCLTTASILGSAGIIDQSGHADPCPLNEIFNYWEHPRTTCSLYRAQRAWCIGFASALLAKWLLTLTACFTFWLYKNTKNYMVLNIKKIKRFEEKFKIRIKSWYFRSVFDENLIVLKVFETTLCAVHYVFS